MSVVVLYLISTSNHNKTFQNLLQTPLYYILFLHQTTTCHGTWRKHSCCIISYFYIKPQLLLSATARRGRCIISYFYIKPQLWHDVWLYDPVVLYLISTSNHNFIYLIYFILLLYYILFLHQTTTLRTFVKMIWKLYYILFLHQTTTPLPWPCNWS